MLPPIDLTRLQIPIAADRSFGSTTPLIYAVQLGIIAKKKTNCQPTRIDINMRVMHAILILLVILMAKIAIISIISIIIMTTTTTTTRLRLVNTRNRFWQERPF